MIIMNCAFIIFTNGNIIIITNAISISIVLSRLNSKHKGDFSCGIFFNEKEKSFEKKRKILAAKLSCAGNVIISKTLFHGACGTNKRINKFFSSLSFHKIAFSFFQNIKVRSIFVWISMLSVKYASCIRCQSFRVVREKLPHLSNE